jgi:hypothetical protein
LRKVLTILPVLALAACASPPSGIDNICAVFDQRDGWFENWQSAAEKTERKYGVPVPVLMATVRKESGFKANARPPRKYYLGFIPGARPSSAYGYSQALDGTWSQYVAESGNWGARRTKFADAVDFVGWYHAKTADSYGVARNDAYRLYLAYYAGWAGYGRGTWQNDPGLQKYAQDTAAMADSYAGQLRSCR